MLVKCEPFKPMKTESTTTEIRKRNKPKRSKRKLITTFPEEKSQEWKQAARFIKQKLLANYLPDELPPRLESQYNKLLGILHRAMYNSENGTAVLLGPPGSGKSLTVRYTLNKIHKEYKSAVKEIVLNGKCIPTEKSCLDEIKRQLISIKEQEKMLDEIVGEEDEMDDKQISKQVEFLQAYMKKFSQQGTTIVFVLDDFDLIAKNAKKAVYHILDCTHSKDVCIVVLCLTCMFSVYDILDKRISSRFLHRRLFFFAPRTTEERVQIFKEILTLPSESKELEKLGITEKYATMYNLMLKKCLDEKSVRQLIDRTQGLNIRFYQTVMKMLVDVLNDGHTLFTPEDFEEIFKFLTVDTRLEIIKDLSALELALLIAIKRTEEVGVEKYNFGFIYNEYYKFMYSAKSTDIKSKDRFKSNRLLSTTCYNHRTALKAFENLVDLKLVKLSRPTKSMFNSESLDSFHIRLNNIHPNEIENFMIENETAFESELFKWATVRHET